MRKHPLFGLAIVGLVPVLALGSSVGAHGSGSSTIPFPDARLKIEYNATDGDAGLQVFLDAPAWRDVSITNPSGRKVLEVEAERVIRNYGLTELFSESSEPPSTSSRSANSSGSSPKAPTRSAGARSKANGWRAPSP
jgi:hypothetical protein